LSLYPGTAIPAGTATPAAAAAPAVATAAAFSASSWSDAALGGLDESVFELALQAAGCAVRMGDVDRPSTLTIIDYSKPSTDERLWVFDLGSHALLYQELVAHGQGSGGNLAVRFSNEPETHSSSIGLFAAGQTYIGKNGYSLRLDGLDKGFNDRARERAIVMHGASYVSDDFVRSQGRLGRSWGCPALPDPVAREVIDHLKGNGLIFAYYPDSRWLHGSKYLGPCTGSPA
jgi:hypothetical protein